MKNTSRLTPRERQNEAMRILRAGAASAEATMAALAKSLHEQRKKKAR